MNPTTHDVRHRLEALRALFAGGDHAGLGAFVEELLDPCQSALAGLVEAVRQGQAPADAREGCLEIRRMACQIRQLVEHAEQVRAGLAGIASLQYWPDGTPRLEAAPRLSVEV
jgi:hypothetical protein